MAIENKEYPIDDAYTENFNEAYLQLGGLGERVLGMVTKSKVQFHNFKYV